MKKRLLNLALVLVMVFALLPLSASAAEIVDNGTCGFLTNWCLKSDGTLIITGNGDMNETGGMNDYDEHEALEFNYTPWFKYRDDIITIIVKDGVTSICDNAFRECHNMTSVSIPASVKSIGDCAFYSCDSLTSVDIPASVTSIGDWTFGYCDSLISIDIPAGVTSIGDWAFNGCYCLKNINVDKANKKYCSIEGILYTKDVITLIQCPCAKSGKVSIPESVTSIGELAFASCNSLTDIDIPNSVKSIGVGAFGECYSLKRIDIPNGVKSIEDDTFIDCYNLETVTIPASVTSVGDFAFDACDELTFVYYGGTESQWNKLCNSAGTNNYPLRQAVVIYEQSYLSIDKQPSNLKAKSGTTGKFSVTATGAGLTYQWQYQKPGSSTWTNSTASGAKTATLSVSVKDSVDGYKYRCTVKDANGFSVTSKTATLTVTSTSTFKDVSSTAYYNDAVSWAVSKGITNGTSATTFSPNNDCTRGQIVTFLWRAKGEPDVSGVKNPFKDVKSTDYYYKAVLWAVKNKITTGVDKTHFAPNNTCTRAQSVTFMWRAEGQPGVKGVKNPFVDVKSSDYYYKAVLWAVSKNITTGVDKTHFAPSQICTRGQIVTFLYRDLK